MANTAFSAGLVNQRAGKLGSYMTTKFALEDRDREKERQEWADLTEINNALKDPELPDTIRQQLAFHGTELMKKRGMKNAPDLSKAPGYSLSQQLKLVDTAAGFGGGVAAQGVGKLAGLDPSLIPAQTPDEVKVQAVAGTKADAAAQRTREKMSDAIGTIDTEITKYMGVGGSKNAQEAIPSIINKVRLRIRTLKGEALSPEEEQNLTEYATSKLGVNITATPAEAKVNQQGIKIMLDAAESWPMMTAEDRANLVKQAMPFLTPEESAQFGEMSLGLSFKQKRALVAETIAKGRLDLAVKSFNSSRQIALKRLAVVQKKAASAGKSAGSGTKINPISAMNSARAFNKAADDLRYYASKDADKLTDAEVERMTNLADSYDEEAETLKQMAAVGASNIQTPNGPISINMPGYGPDGQPKSAPARKTDYSRANTKDSQSYLGRMAKKYKGKKAEWIAANIVWKRHGHDWDQTQVLTALRRHGAK